MKLPITITLLLLGVFVYGQNESDYEIYSVVIDNIVDSLDEDRDTLTNIVVLERLQIEPDQIREYIDILYDENKGYRDWLLNRDTSLIRIIEGQATEVCLYKLKESIENTPYVESTYLRLKTPSTSLKLSSYKKFFRRNIASGWNRFYKQYPNSAGIFGLSGIEYYEDFASFYIEHSYNGLAASGDIVILKKEDNTWTIKMYINLWMA